MMSPSWSCVVRFHCLVLPTSFHLVANSPQTRVYEISCLEFQLSNLSGKTFVQFMELFFFVGCLPCRSCGFQPCRHELCEWTQMRKLFLLHQHQTSHILVKCLWGKHLELATRCWQHLAAEFSLRGSQFWSSPFSSSQKFCFLQIFTLCASLVLQFELSELSQNNTSNPQRIIQCAHSEGILICAFLFVAGSLFLRLGPFNSSRCFSWTRVKRMKIKLRFCLCTKRSESQESEKRTCRYYISSEGNLKLKLGAPFISVFVSFSILPRVF